MKLILRSLKRYRAAVAAAIFIKLLGTMSELLLPYILEYIIDDVVPRGELAPVFFWGSTMFLVAVLTRALNVIANRKAVGNAHRISYGIRQALFEKTINLSGPDFDRFGLPSLISRMTSDSYNVQSAVQQFQTLCVRAPIMLIGGLLVSLVMDTGLAMILVVLLPFLIAVILFVSSRGIPMYTAVQQKLDAIVRIMRENITGIRVVKALSKEDYEIRRFGAANRAMTQQDIAAATVMAIPGPLMQLCLNVGLTFVVLIGAQRVNSGEIRPGVILAFLTYFNMIAMGVMGLSRIFMTMSKASASADRIDLVLQTPAEKDADAGTDEERPGSGAAQKPGSGSAKKRAGDEAVRFEHVSFSYDSARPGEDLSESEAEKDGRASDFAGEKREKALEDISFTIRRGESLGIVGPTGCGKTTIISLLMHFYDAEQGAVYVDGRRVDDYGKDDLRRRFGTVFQNDMIFQDTLQENIAFGREVTPEQVEMAINCAMAREFVEELPEGLMHEMAIQGADVSGGQKQRILVARALAAEPEILILDDSSSALDYRTDAAMRRAIREHYPEATTIMVAQRISSVMGMTRILVLDNGRCIGYGTHEELLKTCEMYRETYEVQMGALA
ncbi:MAG: ABC transporter ATP-binding protein [Lachnospiraceae bacterium]|nr:ABC transporter ATP-binding protein [Lachnospiraceae bacterium]